MSNHSKFAAVGLLAVESCERAARGCGDHRARSAPAIDFFTVANGDFWPALLKVRPVS
jgi:hypothetical protein